LITSQAYQKDSREHGKAWKQQEARAVTPEEYLMHSWMHHKILHFPVFELQVYFLQVNIQQMHLHLEH
jgi:hypothetical protein